MGKSEATKEDWTGLQFANGWTIQKKLSCAEYRAIYIEQTGDTSKQIKNSHYLCYNENCGISTYIERTVIQRAMQSNRDCLTKCKGCSGEAHNCHYSIQCREKKLTKTPDRSTKVQIGEKYGVWKVLDIIPSGLSSDHQMRANCICSLCGEKKSIRFDDLLARDAACECFKNHSCGEMLVKQCLDNCKIKYKTEVIFENLVGLKGGALRYDFGILDKDNDVIALIEFDGEQHYQSAGSYYNATGAVQIHDDIKNEFAKEHNIPLLRIPYYELGNAEGLIIAFMIDNM